MRVKGEGGSVNISNTQQIYIFPNNEQLADKARPMFTNGPCWMPIFNGKNVVHHFIVSNQSRVAELLTQFSSKVNMAVFTGAHCDAH